MKVKVFTQEDTTKFFIKDGDRELDCMTYFEPLTYEERSGVYAYLCKKWSVERTVCVRCGATIFSDKRHIRRCPTCKKPKWVGRRGWSE